MTARKRPTRIRGEPRRDQALYPFCFGTTPFAARVSIPPKRSAVCNVTRPAFLKG
jgi:hypothetical protein